MKSFFRLFSAFVLMCIFSADAWADKPKILLLKDLQPGTEAIGFSVFKGVEPQPFNVVLGEPVDKFGSSFILARIFGGPMDTPLEEIGAVLGMSGSPIFIGCADLDDCIKNGTLVGALSYGPGSFIKGGPNVLLTPAEYMLGARVDGYVAAAEFSSRMPDKINVGGLEFTNLMLFPKMNNLAVRGGSLGKCNENKSVGSELKPGSMVTVFLATGSIPVGGSGTVTWRDDDKIYIFGHQFFGTGMVNYPFVHVVVADIIQTPVNAYKIPGCYLNTEGAMLVDGAFEMAGVVGRMAPIIPLRVELHLNDGGAILDEEIVSSPMARMIINKLPGMWAGQLMGDLNSLSIAYQVRVGIQNEPEIFLKSIIPVGVKNGPNDPFEELFNKVDFVFENLERSGHNYKVEGIKVHIDFAKNFKTWTKKTAFLSQNKATPGETVYVNVVLEEVLSGATKQMSIPIKVPEDFMERKGLEAPSNITVLIQSGNKFTDKREQPAETASTENLIKQMNQSMNYKTNVLYIQQVMPKSKIGQEADKASAKASVKPAWKWTDVEEGDLKQLPHDDKNDVALTLSPALNDFIDLNLTFNFSVQPKKDADTEKKDKEPKHRKWYLLFLSR